MLDMIRRFLSPQPHTRIISHARISCQQLIASFLRGIFYCGRILVKNCLPWQALLVTYLSLFKVQAEMNVARTETF